MAPKLKESVSQDKIINLLREAKEKLLGFQEYHQRISGMHDPFAKELINKIERVLP